MNQKLPNNLFDYFERSFKSFYFPNLRNMTHRIHNVSLHLGPASKLIPQLHDYDRRMAHQAYFLVVREALLAEGLDPGISANQEGWFSTIRISNFFTSGELRADEEKVKRIIDNTRRTYISIAEHLYEYFERLIQSQQDIINFLHVLVKDKNRQVLESIQNKSVYYAATSFSHLNKDLAKVSDEDFIKGSTFVRENLLKSQQKITQEGYADAMKKFFNKSSRATLRTEIERRFKITFKEFIDRMKAHSFPGNLHTEE